MKKLILIAITLLVFLNGCILTEESVADTNQKIKDRYNSFATMKYTVTILLYENDLLIQTEERTEIIKKPDKMKQIIKSDANGRTNISLVICNMNTAYSQITPGLMMVYKYVNLPPEMTTYCGYYIDKGSVNWEIPMSITDETKYKVETSKDVYNGKKVLKCIVTVLISDEAKQKQIAIGSIPRETVAIYWFDADSLAIIKEETHGFYSKGEVITQIGGGSSISNVKEIEIRSEKFYDEFYFDIDIPDSEFEVHTSDYPGVEFDEHIVDMQEKLK